MARTLGRLAFVLQLDRLRRRDHCPILLFHRIDARYRDEISLTPRQFRSYCEFLAGEFEVITLSALLERLRARRSLAGAAVITFDDGYRDNYQVAAPLLRSFGLPACFFIPTGFIDSPRVAWWDAQQRAGSEWMTWSEVRDLSREGFEIGAHTVNHVDLAEVSSAIARSEIIASAERLAEVLGTPVRHFAYPYGTHEQITRDSHAYVTEAGFESSLAVLGRCVHPDAGPFALPRLTISQRWPDAYQFGLELL